jgi:hypothetical protein
MPRRRNAISLHRGNEIVRSWSHETANAREGVVFFWSKINHLGPYEVITGKLLKSKVSIGKMAYDDRDNKPPAQSYLQRGEAQSAQFKEWANHLTRELFKAIGADPPGGQWIGWIAENIVRNIGPLLGSVRGLYKGLKKFGTALVQRVTAWWQGRKVELQSGHPQAMADGITKLINNAMLEGLYEIVKSAAKGTLDVLTVGVTATVGAVISVMEIIVRQVYACYHAVSINDFIDDCKEYMKLPKAARTVELSGEAAAFNDTFRYYTEAVPAIAAITLASCLGGDKMRLLKMYGDDGAPINESSYKAGTKFLDTLNSAGREYSSFWARLLKTSDNVAGLGLQLARDGVANKIVQRPWYKRLLGYSKYEQTQPGH